MATGRIGTTPVLTTRWTKEPSAGTTSLSGLDANSVSLVYSVGYEQVYRNGVLLSRGNDYTATDGTSITLTDATIAGDIIEIFANQTIPLSDTYSQTVADGRFIKNTLTTTTGDIIYASAANTPARLGIGSTGQVLKVSGGVPAWGADSAGALTLITRTSYTGVASQTFDNVFTSAYKVYTIVIENNSAVAPQDDFEFLFRYGTSDSSAHYGNSLYSTPGNTPSALSTSNAAWLKLSPGSGGSPYSWVATMNVHNVGTGSAARAQIYGSGFQNYDTQLVSFGGYTDTSQDFTGFKVRAQASNITGTIAVYGWSIS